MNNQSICEDGALLLGYTAGSLDQEESTRVAAHVGRCTRCQEMVRENENLIRVYRTATIRESSHPSTEILTLLAEGLAGTPEVVEARAHVDDCGECMEVVSVLQKVETDLVRLERSKKAGESMKQWLTGVQAFWERSASWLASPVPAYVLVLLMAYPAYLGLIGLGGLRQRLENLESPALLAPPIAVKSARERGRQEPRLAIEQSGGHRVVTFFIPIADERYLYRVELTRRGNRVFYEDDARSFDGIGTFALYLPDGALAPGDYELRVEEVDKQSGKVVNVIEFAFNVIR
jgi:anti-sigma factor ChrR (cupin superfamily)